MSKTTDIVTSVKTTDLLKVVDQLYIDQMEYARVIIRFDESETLDGAILISGISDFEADEPTKHYGFVPPAHLPNCDL